MEYKEVYTFRNKEINNIYKLFYNTYYNQQDFRGLSQELPQSDTKTAFEKLGQKYTYKWTAKNKMNLEIGYDGGVTTISFEQHDKNAIATMTYNAD